jgi:hypothetical protein
LTAKCHSSLAQHGHHGAGFAIVKFRWEGYISSGISIPDSLVARFKCDYRIPALMYHPTSHPLDIADGVPYKTRLAKNYYFRAFKGIAKIAPDGYCWRSSGDFS